MLKHISNLGTTLKKTEQKNINGGFGLTRCKYDQDCPRRDMYCFHGYCQYK
ncbi:MULTISPECIES: hypothetical protein [Tenacibaculum]|uniref:hypothetical protein n=1 Tax=Tenacibaculum TaxID=104267 RepID=UPI00090EEE6E|nr:MULTISPECIES: hypothetical protein [Tenacibaculum]KAF9659234.1 hypothetical protein HBA12_03030 [Tenacibaculum mesophilum]MCG7500751.1 hypothetical protein [Tenacibaculum sp. Mcav3-52]SHF68792.1 hypothetical protein SAMN05444344_1198 [Tenacibaculum mesophilum]